MKKLATYVIAAGLIGAPAFAAPPAPAPIYNWTGFYIGVNAGWGWSKDNTTVSVPGPSILENDRIASAPVVYQESTNPLGAIGGVQVGYNWQAVLNWILGIEADIQASGENASGNPHGASSSLPSPLFPLGILQTVSPHNDSLLWFGTVRARVGYTVSPTAILYATGGLAYGLLNDSLSASLVISNMGVPVVTTNRTFDASVTKTGWTVGGGLEGLVPNTHVTWKAEYLYMDLGTRNYSFNDTVGFGATPVTISSKFTDNIFRVGLNYQFH